MSHFCMYHIISLKQQNDWFATAPVSIKSIHMIYPLTWGPQCQRDVDWLDMISPLRSGPLVLGQSYWLALCLPANFFVKKKKNSGPYPIVYSAYRAGRPAHGRGCTAAAPVVERRMNIQEAAGDWLIRPVEPGAMQWFRSSAQSTHYSAWASLTRSSIRLTHNVSASFINTQNRTFDPALDRFVICKPQVT